MGSLQRSWSVHRIRRAIKKGRYGEMHDLANKALAKWPDDPRVRMDVAMTLLDGGDPVEVLEHVDRAVELAGTSPEILLRGARLAMTLGQEERARSWAATSRRVGVTLSPLVAALNNLEANFGLRDGAEDDLVESKLAKAFHLAPWDGGFSKDYAEFLLARGRPSEARSVVETGLRKYPGGESRAPELLALRDRCSKANG